MKAEIITIGDELLIGQTIDTNSAWIAEELYGIGITIHRINSIQDTPEEIVRALDESLERSNLILMTGGLGPTLDDITKSTLASYFNTTLELNNDVLAKIEAYFSSVGRPMLQVNIDQAKLPAEAVIVPNELGTASGMWFKQGECDIISMPGVPYEMKGMMMETIIPAISEKYQLPELKKTTVMVQGLGESFIAERVQEWETSLASEGLKLAYLPSPGLVRMRITGNGSEHSQEMIEQKAEDLMTLLPSYAYSKREESLEAVIGKLLLEKKQSVAVAESCTGGYVGHLITSVSGSSAYFAGGIISYSNEVKEQQLGVSSEALNAVGAVSEEVVLQMASGVKDKLGTDYGVAISGIAGPDGGTEEKPVGTVWIAVAGPKATVSKVFSFGNNRERNIRKSALTALNMLRKEILGLA